MKALPILSIVLAFVVGAGLVYALKPGAGDDSELESQLAAAEARIKELEAQTKAAPPALVVNSPAADNTAKPAPSLLPDQSIEDETDPFASAEVEIEKIANSPEVRNLMKMASGFFASQGERMIDREMKKWTEKLELTEAQATAIKGKIMAKMEENTTQLQADLDNNTMSMREIMEAQGEFWQSSEPEIEAMIKGELNAEQAETFEYEQLLGQTQNVQRQADWELRALDGALQLDEGQKDQVFNILVRESRSYDPAMAIEGTEAELPAAAVAEGVSKEDAIRSVLTPEQLETYNGRLESGGFGWRRGGGFGRPR